MKENINGIKTEMVIRGQYIMVKSQHQINYIIVVSKSQNKGQKSPLVMWIMFFICKKYQSNIYFKSTDILNRETLTAASLDTII